MAAGLAVCLVCGKPLEYFEEAQTVTCEICGAEDTGHSVCVDGHYVCDRCHRAGGVDWIMDYCESCSSRNPVEIAQALMDNQAIYPNGPEHHTLVGAALMTAYANASGVIELPGALAELRQRSMAVPGGACGFWGTCGAAVSAGQFYSIISGSTPMTREPWAQTQRLTSRILGRLADLGGPRCCKRTCYAALEETAGYLQETRGVALDMPEQITCTHFPCNAECLKTECPYFPGSQRG